MSVWPEALNFSWKYRACVERVIDGDSVYLDIDQGLHGWRHHENIRLFGLNTADRNLEAKRAATAYLRNILTPGRHVLLQTIKDRTEKYGRYLGKLWIDVNGLPVSVNDMLIVSGHALPWDGTGTPPE